MIPARLAVYGAVGLLLLGGFAWAWQQGAASARARDARQQIEARERADDAAHDYRAGGGAAGRLREHRF